MAYDLHYSSGKFFVYSTNKLLVFDEVTNGLVQNGGIIDLNSAGFGKFNPIYYNERMRTNDVSLMAEIELHVLNGLCLNRHISTKEKVEKEVDAWQSNRNNKHSKINWQFTTEDARIKLKRPYPSFQD